MSVLSTDDVSDPWKYTTSAFLDVVLWLAVIHLCGCVNDAHQFSDQSLIAILTGTGGLE